MGRELTLLYNRSDRIDQEFIVDLLTAGRTEQEVLDAFENQAATVRAFAPWADR